MPDFTLYAPPTTIRITGFQPRLGLIQDRRGIKAHDGPTIELTATFPCDDPEVFHVPYPLRAPALRKRVAFYGALLLPPEGKALEALIDQFAAYVAANHGWNRPYRH